MNQTELEVQILTWFQQHDPRTIAEINAAGIKTQLIGFGSDRRVFELVGTDFVVKIPFGIAHQSANEEFVIRSIYFFYPTLRPLLPEVIFFNPQTEILVMRRYRAFPKDQAQIKSVRTQLQVASDWTFGDVSAKNLGLDDDGGVKMVDLGSVVRRRCRNRR